MLRLPPPLPLPDVSVTTTPTDINDRGQIAGTVTTGVRETSESHAVLW